LKPTIEFQRGLRNPYKSNLSWQKANISLFFRLALSNKYNCRCF